MSSSGLPSVGVVGAGLIGGSIVKAAVRAGYPVRAHDRFAHHSGDVIAAGAGWCESIADLVHSSDVLVIAVPGDAVPSVVDSMLPHLRPGQILTDVSSTKTSPTMVLATAPSGVTVVGGHPLAGKHVGGWPESTETLFTGCVWVLCPADGETVPGTLTGLVTALGAERILVCSPDEHDRAVASISHGVQAASTAIAAAVGNLVAEDHLPWLLAAGGWRDTTRIAESHPDLWVPILMDNADHVVPVLAEIEAHLTSLRDAIALKDAARIREVFEDGNTARSRWTAARHTPDTVH